MRLFCLLFVLFLFSCAGKNHYIESFYYKEDIQQYYVKAIEFKGDDASLLVDFTFKNDTTMEYSTICNFTIQCDEAHTLPLKSLTFTTGDKSFSVKAPKVLFAEGSKAKYRFTSNLTTEEFKSLIFSESITVEAVFSDWSGTFSETKSIRDMCRIARQDIIFK